LRVLFTHAYSMTEVRRLCERGEYPRQHLWAADALERGGHEVVWGPFGGDERLARLTRLTRGKLGYLDQEVALAQRGALVYSADQNLTRGLAYLRRYRLMSVFHSIGPPSFAGRWVRNIDVALALSRRTRDRLVDDYGRDRARTLAVRWGPDLGYGGYRDGPFEVVVSSGKSGRDFATLRAALGRTGLPSVVHALAPGQAPRDLNDVLADVRRASVVAIPLADPDKLLGLSELNDALACGKPVVMTRSPHFDFDIEAEGFGVWVDPGDVDGFAAALARVAADLGEAAAMGRRARAFAERAWNYEIFCTEVASSVVM
jgi:glycosyltransferase involved in cell wall biosynthesis